MSDSELIDLGTTPESDDSSDKDFTPKLSKSVLQN